jgi:hypothetical protein
MATSPTDMNFLDYSIGDIATEILLEGNDKLYCVKAHTIYPSKSVTHINEVVGHIDST